MVWPSLYQLVESSKVIIAFIVMAYAYFFMRQSQKTDERRPWEYLYIGGMFLFIAELIVALRIARPLTFSDPIYTSVESFMQFVFLGFFLFSFISQHHLLIKRHIIFIQKSPDKAWFDRLRDAFHQRWRQSSEQREEATFRRKVQPDGIPVAHPAATPSIPPAPSPVVHAVHRAREPAPKEPRPSDAPTAAVAEPEPELPRLDEEPEHAPTPASDVEALLKQGTQLAIQIEDLLSRYKERVNPATATKMQERVTVLKALLAERPPRPTELKRQIGLLLGR